MGPNAVNFTIATGRKRWYVVREYVPPNDQLVVHQIVQALSHGLVGVEKLIVGDLNADLAHPTDQ